MDSGEVVEPHSVEEFIAEPASRLRPLVEYPLEPEVVSICMVGPVVTLTTYSVAD